MPSSAGDWNRLASDGALERTVLSLTANGRSATLVPDSETARRKVLALLPDGVTVMNVTSTTLDQIGLS
ncbi:MAG TPA: LUD domain-containing protein [Vicinamibacterales bacterium]|nr:LUD domain-containing protein [Vicinamibacterales bacterium]